MGWPIRPRSLPNQLVALSGPVSGVPATVTIDGVVAFAPYSVGAIGNTVYYAHQDSGDLFTLVGVAFTPFVDGVWGVAVTVNDGLVGNLNGRITRFRG